MSQTITIFIVRHGHAKFSAPTDFDRALKDKGVRMVEATAQFINAQCLTHKLTPLLCISSAAKRTKETAQIIAKTVKNIRIDAYQELYATSVSSWLSKIEQSPEKCLILVGHNPTLSQMVNYFCGHNLQMKPAECALIKLEIKADGIIYPATLIDYHHNE